MTNLLTCAWVIAIRRGFMLSLPIVLFAGFAVAIGNIPFQQFVDWPFLGTVQSFFAQAGSASFGIMSLYLVLTISYSLSLLKSAPLDHEVNPEVVAIIAMLCFLAVILPGNGQIEPDLFGMISVLPAVLTALLATELFYHLLLYPKLVICRYYNDADPILPGLLRLILPASLTIGAFFLFHALTSWGQAPAATFISHSLSHLFETVESPLARLLLFVLISQAFWFFGVHGNAVLKPVETMYLDSATALNIATVEQGFAPTEVITKQLLDVFVLMGGSGTALTLVIAILIFWRKSNQQRVAQISLIPALFNISEIIVFALPVVLNPTFLIPFIATPIVLVLTTYIATISGFIPPISTPIHWTTPPLIGGYLASGSWHGVALQLFNIGIGVLIYMPFIRLAQKAFHQARLQSFQAILAEIETITTAKAPKLMSRHDRVGGLVRQLSKDLEHDLDTNRFYLVYQPQVDPEGKAVGVEALARWNHGIFGPIPPHVFISIAEETDLIHELGIKVFRQSCCTLSEWQMSGLTDIKMSVNLSPIQLSNPEFFYQVNETLKATGVNTNQVELEITESIEAGHDDHSTEAIAGLSSMGFRIAMDDFGMGYSSMLYLRRFQLDSVKLDGTLTRDIIENQTCREIITAISSLCQTKNIHLVAEYVETAPQRDLLYSMGCEVFQGYYYSPPIAEKDCLDYLKSLPTKVGQNRAQRVSLEDN